MPVFFAAMLVPLWRGPRRAIGWGVAGVVAVAAEHVAAGWWFIIAGAVSARWSAAFSTDVERGGQGMTDLGTGFSGRDRGDDGGRLTPSAPAASC